MNILVYLLLISMKCEWSSIWYQTMQTNYSLDEVEENYRECVKKAMYVIDSSLLFRQSPGI